jgi:hypothetical protein
MHKRYRLWLSGLDLDEKTVPLAIDQIGLHEKKY